MGEHATDISSGESEVIDLRRSGFEDEATRGELEDLAGDLERANAQLVEAIDEARAFGAEMAVRTAELDGLHDLFEATLARSAQALLVLDAHLVVRGWSGGAVERFGPAADRVVGRRLVSLRCAGLPAGRIAAAARDALAGRASSGDVPFSCHPVPGRAEATEAVVVVFDRPTAGASGVDDDMAPEPGDDARQPA